MRRSAFLCLSIEGALALGFFTAFVVSINMGDVVGIMFFPVIILSAWLAFVHDPQIQRAVLPFLLLITAFFSFFSSGLVPSTNGAPSVLWSILVWLPIVLMCFLKWKLDRSIIDRIKNGIVILFASGFFLGMGMGCGMTAVEPYFLDDRIIPYSGTLFFLVFFATFAIIFLFDWIKRKKG